MSLHRINRVGVVGAGVMGTGIACHLASCGIDVLLVDIVPRDAPAAVAADDKSYAAVRKARNAIAQGGLDRALKLKPAPIHRAAEVSRIGIGNLDDDLVQLGACDWIVEAVTERIDIKNAVFEKIEAHRKPHTIVSSNTSGIPLATMAAPRWLSENSMRELENMNEFPPPEAAEDLATLLRAYEELAVSLRNVFWDGSIGGVLHVITNPIETVRGLAHQCGPRLDQWNSTCPTALGGIGFANGFRETIENRGAVYAAGTLIPAAAG